jgi:hypothetical protein
MATERWKVLDRDRKQKLLTDTSATARGQEAEPEAEISGQSVGSALSLSLRTGCWRLLCFL